MSQLSLSVNMNRIVVILIGIVLPLTCIIAIPATDDGVTMQIQHVMENSSVLIICNSTQLPDMEDFFWIKNDTAGKKSVLYGQGWKQEFYSVARGDRGVYVCHALDISTGENATLTAITLDVQYPAEIQAFSLGPRVIRDNETFSVTCSMWGNPQPTWGIYDNETGISVLEANLSADAQLSAVPVRCGYSGMWVCTGRNEYNNDVNVTRGEYLTVLCSPRPDPSSGMQPDYMYLATLSDNVTMVMTDVLGDPPPTFTWSRDDKPLGHVGVGQNNQSSNLTILDVGVEDFGQYKLVMNNSMGSYVVNFTLKAYGYPQKPYDFHASNVSHTSVVLSWTSGFDMGSKQTFEIIKFVDNTYQTIGNEISGPYDHGGVGQNWTYRLTGLEPGTEYTLGVLAENSQNFTRSDKIVFNTTALPHRPDSQTASAGLIAGGVVGGALLLLIVVAIASIVYRRRNSQAAALKDTRRLVTPTNNQYGGTYAATTEKQALA